MTVKIQLSREQARLWFDCQHSPNAQTNYAQLCYKLLGPLDVDLFERATVCVLNSHNIFKTQFVSEEGRVHKYFLDAMPSIEVHVFSELSRKDGTIGSIDAYISDVLSAPIDFLSYPNYRIILLEESSDVHYLLVSIPHVLADGLSASFLLEALSRHYNDGVKGEVIPSIEERFTETECFAAKEYWEKHLDGAPTRLSFSQKKATSSSAPSLSSRCYLSTSSEAMKGVRRVARQSRTTVFLTLFSLFSAALYKYSHQKKFSVLYPINTRNRQQRKAIGFYVNLVPLVFDVDPEIKFSDFLMAVTRQRKCDREHESYPYHKVLSLLRKDEGLGDSSYNVVFSRTKLSSENFTLLGIKIEPYCFSLKKSALFDLVFTVDYDEAGLVVALDYNEDVYDAWFVEQFLDYFNRLIENIESLSSLSLGRLPYFCALPENNAPSNEAGHVATHTLQNLFHQSVKKAPKNIALSDGDSSWTYQAVDDLSNQWARFLLTIGVNAGDRLGIFLDRSPNVVVLMLAILKLRCAYIPLETKLPASTIIDILGDASVDHLVFDKEIDGINA